MSSWNHSICDPCYAKEQPGREPVRVKEEFRKDETCCFCGNWHHSGIFYRKDPQLTLCKGSCSDDD